MDRLLTSDGKPYGPIRYKEIVKESYVLMKNVHASYSDIMNMTPRERNYLLEFLNEEFQRTQEELDKIKQKNSK